MVGTDEAVSRVGAFVPLVVGDLQLELDVVPDVRVLPHQELNAARELTPPDFFVQHVPLVLRVSRAS